MSTENAAGRCTIDVPGKGATSLPVAAATPSWLRLAGETYVHAPTRRSVVVLDRVYGRRLARIPRYVVRPVQAAAAAPFVAVATDLLDVDPSK